MGFAMAQFAQALRHKTEGRGLVSLWDEWNFSFT